MNNELPIQLYKANAELQLQITRLLQESGHRWLEAMQQLSAGSVEETTARIQSLQQAADWQTLATLPSEVFRRLYQGRVGDAKHLLKPRPRASPPLSMACARRSRSGRRLSPRQSVLVETLLPLRIFFSHGHSLGLHQPPRPSARPKSEEVAMSTSQRTALVTGGNRGLGAAIARALHDAGHRVIVTHTPGNTTIDQWQQAQAAQNYTFAAYGVDVSEYESTQELARRIHADGHRVDILVNNAGITRDASLRKLDKAGWDAVLRTNLDSLFNVTKLFIDSMVERGWGRIVNISSINGSKGQFGQTNYSAAKAGAHGFTKALAQEVARKGVTVNTVSPGYLVTEMVMAVHEDVRQKIIDAIPVGRLGQPDEIAALVAFIASDAAAFMTGSNVAMNGGQHMY
jgi:acetoacetyl-CoA reductase